MTVGVGVLEGETRTVGGGCQPNVWNWDYRGRVLNYYREQEWALTKLVGNWVRVEHKITEGEKGKELRIQVLEESASLILKSIFL